MTSAPIDRDRKRLRAELDGDAPARQADAVRAPNATPPPHNPSFLASALSAPASSGRSSAKARFAARKPILEPQS